MGIDTALLDQMDKTIATELGVKKLTAIQRRALEMDRLMVMFMRQASDDHKEIEKLKKASIGWWVQNNPKLTIFFVTVFIILASMVDIRDVLAMALGL